MKYINLLFLVIVICSCNNNYFKYSKYQIVYIGSSEDYLDSLKTYYYQFKEYSNVKTYNDTLQIEIDTVNEFIVEDHLFNDIKGKTISYKGYLVKIKNNTNNPIFLSNKDYLELIAQTKINGEWKDIQEIDNTCANNFLYIAPDKIYVIVLPKEIITKPFRLKFGKSYSNEI